MDVPRYKTGRVLEVAGISREVLKNWERKERRLIEREPGRLFTFRRALQVAIMAKLVEMGTRPEVASKASWFLTDKSELPNPTNASFRRAGGTFHYGLTLLCIYPNEHFETRYVPSYGYGPDLFHPMGQPVSEAVLVLNVNYVIDRVAEQLDEK